MPQAMTGKQKSTPRVVRVNADDNEAVLYKNLGNGKRYPFIIGTSVTVVSGTSCVLVSSGVLFGGYPMCSGTVIATPTSTGTMATGYCIEKDTTNNMVNLKMASTVSVAADFDIMIMMGVDYSIVNA